MDSLLQKIGSITTDSVQIHNKLTEAFAEHLACPQHHIHSPLQADDGIELERFLAEKVFQDNSGTDNKKISDDA